MPWRLGVGPHPLGPLADERAQVEPRLGRPRQRLGARQLQQALDRRRVISATSSTTRPSVSR